MTTRRKPGSGYREVDVAPLREAFLRSGKTAAEVANALDWNRVSNGCRVASGDRVRKALGITPTHSRGHCLYQRTTTYERAVRLARAIGVDPYEVGL